MQTLTIGRSQYTLNPTRDVGALQDKFSKCTGKPKKPSIARERRDYPVFEAGMSTAMYVSLFQDMNAKHFTPDEEYFAPLNKDVCTLYSGADVHELIDDLSDDAGDPVPVIPAHVQAIPAPAPVADPGRVRLILHNVLVPLQYAAPDGVPTVAGMESEAARLDASADSMADYADPQGIANYREVARSLRELASTERARLAPVPGKSSRTHAEDTLRAYFHESLAPRSVLALRHAPSGDLLIWEVTCKPSRRMLREFGFTPEGQIERIWPDGRIESKMVHAQIAPPPGEPEADDTIPAPLDGLAVVEMTGAEAMAAMVPAMAPPATQTTADQEASRKLIGSAIIEQDLDLDESISLVDHVEAGGAVENWTRPITLSVDSGAVAYPVPCDDQSINDAWSPVLIGRVEPSEYQAHILECLEDVHAGIRAQGKYPYNSDAWPRIAALMALRHGYPDASVEATEGGWFGTHCYMAGQLIRRREETKREREAAASFNAGQIFPRLIFDDGKQVTCAHLLEMSDSGYHCKLSGKRGGSVVTITCTASALQAAIDRARVRVQVLADQRARSKPAPVVPPPGDSQSVLAPPPVHSAPVQSDPIHDRPMPAQAAQTGFEGLSDPELRAYIEGCHRDQQFGIDFWRAAREINDRKDSGAWTDPPTTKAARVPMKPCDRPMAGPGLTSYRARSPYGWIMIGALDDAEAMREALRSTDEPTDLQVWDGGTYVPCEAPPSGELNAAPATPIRALRGAESHQQAKPHPSSRTHATARADPPLRIPAGRHVSPILGPGFRRIQTGPRGGSKPALWILPGDLRGRIPARFAPCYVLQP